jgi:hypothetical protein
LALANTREKSSVVVQWRKKKKKKKKKSQLGAEHTAGEGSGRAAGHRQLGD